MNEVINDEELERLVKLHSKRPRDPNTPYKKPPPRIIVLGSISHQNPDEQPRAVESRYVKLLETEDQPILSRKFTVGEEWQELDCGWLKTPGMVYIENLEGIFTRVIPEVAEVEEAKRKVIEIGDGAKALFEVPAGEDHRGVPCGKLFVRCRHGSARYSLSVFPR